MFPRQGKDTLWNFSFTAFHEIQFQEQFMKNKILSRNLLLYYLNFIAYVYHQRKKKLCLQRKDTSDSKNLIALILINICYS